MTYQVLVIDDDRQVRETLHDVLDNAGYDVEVATDGNQGLQIRRRHPVDVLITDILMPNKEGIETIAEFRKSYPGTPIIAVSGGGRSGNMDFLMMAQMLGADRILEKPIAPDDLLDAVGQLLCRAS